MFIFLLIIVAIIGYILYNIHHDIEYKKNVIELADRGVPEYQDILNKFFDDGMTDEEHNKLRKERYLPKAQKGDPHAEYYMGLLADNKKNRLSWWTKSAEHGNIEAMNALALGYSKWINEDDDDMFAFGYKPELENYWRNRIEEVKRYQQEN